MTRNHAQWLGIGGVFAAGALVWGVLIANDTDNWAPCSEAIEAQYGPSVDYAVSEISWTKQDDVEVAHGSFDTGGSPYRFECAVAGGDVQWLDVS